MINPEELVICRKRGHKTPGLMRGFGWMQCELCGMWIRSKEILEEQEQEPPEDEIDQSVISARILRRIGNELKERKQKTEGAEGGAGKAG